MTKMKLPLVPHGTDVQSTETGSWRTFKPKLKTDICTKCGVCITFCPDGVIRKSKDAVEIDYVFCKGCGVCAEECSVKAIEMVIDE